MTRTTEDTWRELSPHLNEMLELEPGARRSWLDQLATRDPSLATQLMDELLKLDQLNAQNFLGTPVSTLFESATPAGQRFGPYTLEKMIGHGGMGTVWLAARSDGRFEGQVAVKLLNTLVGQPAERRFVREASVLAKLRHSNIAHLLDAGVAADFQPYLILEYIEGEPIDQYCDRHSLGVRERIELFLDVLAAVTHAHNHLIVHRDLKPANILVTREGTVKLLDFGVAALLSASEDGARESARRTAGVTPGYAAPEQLRAEPVTTATDVYALGVILFLLLTGRLPASSEPRTAAELIRLTLDAEAPQASTVTSDTARQRSLRGDLDSILAMALRIDPAQRYNTVLQLAQDLRRHLAIVPVSARPHSLRYVASTFVRRHRFALAALATLGLVIVAATVLTTYEMLQARSQRDQARYQSRRAEASVDFLTELMRINAAPTGALPTFHDRLDFGAQLLEERYRQDPAFAGRLMIDLADYYRHDGETTRAIALYQRAYTMGEPRDFALMGAAQCGRAQAEGLANTMTGAGERADAGLRLLGQAHGADPALLVGCLTAKAVIEHRSGADPAAEALLRQAMSTVEDMDGNDEGLASATLLGFLGSIYFERNRISEALRAEQRAGEIQDRNGRGTSSARLVTRENVAAALAAMGEVRSALAENATIDRQLLKFGKVEDLPLHHRINYATLLLRAARVPDAAAMLNGIVDRARDAGNSVVLAHALLSSGAVAVDLREWQEAERELDETAAISATNDRGTAALAEALLAQLNLGRDMLPSAHHHYQRALELAGYESEKPARTLARVLLTASRVAQSEHAPQDAQRFARDALAISESVARGADTSADVGEALLRLAEVQLSVDQHAAVRPVLARAERCLTNGLDANHPLSREARRLLGSVEG